MSLLHMSLLHILLISQSVAILLCALLRQSTTNNKKQIQATSINKMYH